MEAWVIRASGRKLLEARIDQLRGRVAVTRIPQRTFTADQWRQLTAQLGAWKVQALHFCLSHCRTPCISGLLQQPRCMLPCEVDSVYQPWLLHGTGCLGLTMCETPSPMLQENVWTMKDVISSHTDTGLSRGLPAPKAVHAGV